MRRLDSFRWSLGLLLGLPACASSVAAEPYPEQAPPEGEVERPRGDETKPLTEVAFFDRGIDLDPFLTGFPYRDFEASIDAGRLFYLDARDTYTLRMLDLTPDAEAEVLDLGAGRALGATDWSKRSLWGVEYLPKRRELWLHADADNDEQMNLWVLDLGGKAELGEPEQRTQADYVYAFGVSQDERSIAYLPRRGERAPYETCLHLLDLDTGSDRRVLCDDAEVRFTWGTPRFSPDGRQVYFNAQLDGDRRRVQLVRVDLDAKKPKAQPITATRRSRSSASTLEGWGEDGRLLFVANDDGYRNLYAYDPRRNRVRQLTTFKEDISGAVRVDGGVWLSHGTPAGSTIELIDLSKGVERAEALVRGSMPGKVAPVDGSGDRVLWTHRAPDVVFELLSSRIVRGPSGAAFENRVLAEPAPEVGDAMVQCEARAVRVPTFDTDPATGKTRELHAFLLRPKHPLEAEAEGAAPVGMVRSFYGGDNVYNRFDHIMCAAGVTVLSPAVRGSSGFGKAFAALNDGDLGGAEIVDLFYAGRWLADTLEVGPERVGVYGRSHGGYATMRAMTFSSDELRELAPGADGFDFDFGFGLADAGFSDIVAFHDATNIPDWVHLESGDPADPKQRERMLERSPLYAVGALRAPIFLLHGAADWRVPVEGSRSFARAAEAAGKEVVYVEVEGQGHHVEGAERIAETFQARFDFLMSVLRPAEGDVSEGDVSEGAAVEGSEPSTSQEVPAQ